VLWLILNLECWLYHQDHGYVIIITKEYTLSHYHMII